MCGCAQHAQQTHTQQSNGKQRQQQLMGAVFTYMTPSKHYALYARMLRHRLKAVIMIHIISSMSMCLCLCLDLMRVVGLVVRTRDTSQPDIYAMHQTQSKTLNGV